MSHAGRYNASVVGYTLSPEQARRGNELSGGLDVELRAADATATGLDDGSFDLVWSLESGEHMPNKTAFVGELGRLCNSICGFFSAALTTTGNTERRTGAATYTSLRVMQFCGRPEPLRDGGGTRREGRGHGGSTARQR